MRARHIELACGLALQRNSGLTWRCINGTTFEGGLRDVVCRLAHNPEVAHHYSHAPGLETTYEIISDIRSQCGWNFLWNLHCPDDSAAIISDELDDICCESRAWFTPGDIPPWTIIPVGTQARPALPHTSIAAASQALLWVVNLHNRAMGAEGIHLHPPLFAPLPWSLHWRDQLWVFRDGQHRSFASTRTRHPRGTVDCPHTAQLCGRMVSLANHGG